MMTLEQRKETQHNCNRAIMVVMEAAELSSTVCMCSTVREMNRAMTQFYDIALAPSKIKSSQFTTLNAIAQAGEIAQCDFARHYAVTVETLSRRFSKLRQRGLIASRTGSRSERIYHVTEQGETVLRNSRPYWNSAQTCLKQALEEAGWQLFFRSCERAVCASLLAEELRSPNGRRFHMHETTPAD
jgi:DNA-binding MarR family transcriptional regulator